MPARRSRPQEERDERGADEAVWEFVRGDQAASDDVGHRQQERAEDHAAGRRWACAPSPGDRCGVSDKVGDRTALSAVPRPQAGNNASDIGLTLVLGEVPRLRGR